MKYMNRKVRNGERDILNLKKKIKRKFVFLSLKLNV